MDLSSYGELVATMGSAEEENANHHVMLQPSVVRLEELQSKAQLSYWDLKMKFDRSCPL